MENTNKMVCTTQREGVREVAGKKQWLIQCCPQINICYITYTMIFLFYTTAHVYTHNVNQQTK